MRRAFRRDASHKRKETAAPRRRACVANSRYRKQLLICVTTRCERLIRERELPLRDGRPEPWNPRIGVDSLARLPIVSVNGGCAAHTWRDPLK